MKILRQTIFAFVAVIGLSVAVSAQKDDKRRPKPPPPVVIPGDKKPPKEKPPRDGDKPKKPGMAFILVLTRHESDKV